MPTVDQHYLGARIGATSAGLPLYAIVDPCTALTAPDHRFGIRLGASSAGLPLFGYAPCTGQTPTVNSTYAGILLGASSGGLPLYAIPCCQEEVYSCCPGDVIPETLYLVWDWGFGTPTRGDATLIYDAGNDWWTGCGTISGVTGGPTRTGANCDFLDTGDAVTRYTLCCREGVWSLNITEPTCIFMGSSFRMIDLSCDDPLLAPGCGALSITELDCDPLHLRLPGVSEHADITP